MKGPQGTLGKRPRMRENVRGGRGRIRSCPYSDTSLLGHVLIGTSLRVVLKKGMDTGAKEAEGSKSELSKAR